MFQMGWERLAGTGVATAQKIVERPTPFLVEFDQSFTKFGESDIIKFCFTKLCDIINTGFVTQFGDSPKLSTNQQTTEFSPSLEYLIKISPNLVKIISQHLVSPNFVTLLTQDFSPYLVIPHNFQQINKPLSFHQVW